MAYFERVRPDSSRRHSSSSDSQTLIESLSLVTDRPSLRSSFPRKWSFSTYRNSILSNKIYLGAVAIAVCLLITWLLLDVKINVQIHRPCVNASNSLFLNYTLGNSLNGLYDEDLSSYEWRNYTYYLHRLEQLSSSSPSFNKPRAFKLTNAPPFSYSQFSSYRMNASTFVSVGFGFKLFLKYDLFKSCWWMEYNGKNIFGKVKTFKIGEDNEDGEYTTVIFHCVLDKETKIHGGSAHVMIGKNDFLFYEEKIGKKHALHPPRAEKLPFYLSNCIAPQTQSLETRTLIEYMAYHMHLGISHFSFYDAGYLDDATSALLEQYLKRNVLEIIPYRDIQRYGLFSNAHYVSLHDCLYHSRSTSRWVLASDLDEYLYLPPPSSLLSLLAQKDDVSFLTHGTQVWSLRMCRHGPPVFGSDKWVPSVGLSPMAVERMVFRWPHVVCHGGNGGDDFDVCLGGKGWRKYIFNPRMVFTLGLWQVLNYAGEGEDLNFKVAHHMRFANLHLKLNFSQACEVVFEENESVEWWVKDESFASFTKELRQSIIPIPSLN